MTGDEILAQVVEEFRRPNVQARRRFLPGLLVSFIGLLRSVNAIGAGKYRSLHEFYEDFPRRTKTRGGGDANTLIITVEGKARSIRPSYEAFVRWVRIDNKRLDYPKAAPHATQAWDRYTVWLESLLAMSDAEIQDLEQKVRLFVLSELPVHERVASEIRREPTRFSLFLEDFDMTPRKNEPQGAVYQGTVFGYIRADAAHLQVETNRVKSGGKREKRVGDIDALNGDALVLSAEVKQYVVEDAEVPDFEEFAIQISNQGALGLVVALDFAPGVREQLSDMGLEPVSKRDLRDRVRLWDALKQRVAVDALIYYLARLEQKKALIDRVEAFFGEIERKFAADVAAAAGAVAAIAPAAEDEGAPEGGDDPR